MVMNKHQRCTNEITLPASFKHERQCVHLGSLLTGWLPKHVVVYYQHKNILDTPELFSGRILSAVITKIRESGLGKAVLALLILHAMFAVPKGGHRHISVR